MTAPVRSSTDTHLPRSTILVVDDNPPNVELIQAYLESMDCTTEVAVDGLEALSKVPKVMPDLIILDVMMPRMSGFEVCRKLKSDARYRDIPILMIGAALCPAPGELLFPVSPQRFVQRPRRYRPAPAGLNPHWYAAFPGGR